MRVLVHHWLYIQRGLGQYMRELHNETFLRGLHLSTRIMILRNVSPGKKDSATQRLQTPLIYAHTGAYLCSFWLWAPDQNKSAGCDGNICKQRREAAALRRPADLSVTPASSIQPQLQKQILTEQHSVHSLTNVQYVNQHISGLL